MREFDDVWVWNSNPGEAFKVKEGVFILKTPLGKYEVACKGDPCNTTWDCCIKMSKVPDWGLVPKDEPKSDNHVLVCGDYAYISTGKDETIKIVPLSDYIEPKKPKIGDEVIAWGNSARGGKSTGVYINHTGGKNTPYQVKTGVYTAFFENIKLHPNNAPTAEEQLDSALAIFDDGGSKSDTLANLLDMTLEGMKVSKLNAELEGNIMTAISISSEIADLKSLLKDIKDWV